MYSPSRMSKWIPESACVSTSSVRNTLVTALSWINGVEPLKLDRSIDTQVGSRAFWQFFVERHVHCHCALLHRRIDAFDMAFDHPVTGVDRRLLIWLNIFRLRLRNFDLRLEFRWISH